MTPFSKFYCWDLSNFYIHVHNIVWLLLTIVWEFVHLLIPSVLVTSWTYQNFPFHLNFPFWFLDLDRLRDGEESSSWAGSECKHPNCCKWRNCRWGAAYRLGPYICKHPYNCTNWAGSACKHPFSHTGVSIYPSFPAGNHFGDCVTVILEIGSF